MGAPASFSVAGLTDLTGALGVGSILMLGFFLFLDGSAHVFLLVEANANSQSWIIFMTLPLLFTSYLGGVLCMSLGGVLRMRFARLQLPSQFLASLEHDMLEFWTGQYRDFQRRRDTLEGCFVAFGLLPIGVYFEASHYGLSALAWAIGLASLTVSMLCLILANQTEKEFRASMTAQSGIAG